MSTEQEDLSEPEAENTTDEVGEEQKQPLKLDVKIDNRGACQRHVTVVIARDDIDRYRNEAFSEIMGDVRVPGFRAGRAPRKLVESKFAKEISDQVKGSLVPDSMTQVTLDHKLAPISEPVVDADAIVLPDDGPLTYEFDLEVRPEFDLPNWKGVKLRRPVRDISESDVERRVAQIFQSHARRVSHDGPAEKLDYLAATLSFHHEGELVNTLEEVEAAILPTLSFRDGRIEGFDALMVGVKAGESRKGTIKISENAPNARFRGTSLDVEIHVHEVKRVKVGEITPEFLQENGCESEEELRGWIRDSLQQQLQYEQHRQIRAQLVTTLTVAADWELPPELLKKQTQREFDRAILEMRKSGMHESEITRRANAIRQNSAENTVRALKEHFILEKLAEESKIDASEDDFDREIAAIAARTMESPRRIRAALEKHGQMDILRNQIVERKAIELILSEAQFTEVPFQFETNTVEALDLAAAGSHGELQIPEAKYADDPTAKVKSGLPDVGAKDRE